jgi:hypothetical protein
VPPPRFILVANEVIAGAGIFGKEWAMHKKSLNRRNKGRPQFTGYFFIPVLAMDLVDIPVRANYLSFALVQLTKA